MELKEFIREGIYRGTFKNLADAAKFFGLKRTTLFNYIRGTRGLGPSAHVIEKKTNGRVTVEEMKKFYKKCCKKNPPVKKSF